MARPMRIRHLLGPQILSRLMPSFSYLSGQHNCATGTTLTLLGSWRKQHKSIASSSTVTERIMIAFLWTVTTTIGLQQLVDCGLTSAIACLIGFTSPL